VRRRSRVGAPPVVVRASRKSASARKDVRTSERHSRKYLRARPTDRSIDRSIDSRDARVWVPGARRWGVPRGVFHHAAHDDDAHDDAHDDTPPSHQPYPAHRSPHTSHHITPHRPHRAYPPRGCAASAQAPKPTIAIPAKISADRARSIAPFQTRTTRTRTPRGRSDDRWRLNTRRRAQGQGLSANRDQGRARPHTPDARETPHIDRAIDARDR